jgi:hypothetical protein
VTVHLTNRLCSEQIGTRGRLIELGVRAGSPFQIMEAWDRGFDNIVWARLEGAAIVADNDWHLADQIKSAEELALQRLTAAQRAFRAFPDSKQHESFALNVPNTEPRLKASEHTRRDYRPNQIEPEMRDRLIENTTLGL